MSKIYKSKSLRPGSNLSSNDTITVWDLSTFRKILLLHPEPFTSFTYYKGRLLISHGMEELENIDFNPS